MGRTAAPVTDDATAFDDSLRDGPGYLVIKRLVPPHLVDATLRRLNLEIVRHGITAEQVAEWSLGTFFPHLRWEPEVLATREPVERLVAPREGEQWGDAQLLLRFPDEASDWPLTPHVDVLPEWAGTRTYRLVAGVALTPSHAGNGGLAVWPGSHLGAESEPVRLELAPGDAVLMHPLLQHSSTLNTGGSIRYAVYYRLLTAA